MDLAHTFAHLSLRAPLAERLLRLACAAQVPGALRVAHAYTKVLARPEVRTATFQGYNLNVDVAEFRGVESFFRRNPLYLWFAPHLIESGDTCIDAGANMGHYTLMMAAQIGPTGRVFAFEPQTFLNQLIARSARENGFEDIVTTDDRALHHTSGESFTFYLGSPDNSGLASLYETFYRGPLAGQRRGAGTMTVQTVTLADLFEEQGIEHCRLLKIDVEGAEHEVLLGATSLLADRRIDYLIVETFPRDKAENLLLEMGYAGYRADEAAETLTPIQGNEEGIGDYLFISPDVPRDHYGHLLAGETDARTRGDYA